MDKFSRFSIICVKLNYLPRKAPISRTVFWKKAWTYTGAFPNCVKKLVYLYQVWRELRKNCKKTQNIYKRREDDFHLNMDNLFDIAHADALERVKEEEDKIFLERQRKKSRPSSSKM